jgi:putative restriction endonuclease
VAAERVDTLRAAKGSVAAALGAASETEPTGEEIDIAREQLEAQLEEDPPDEAPIDYTTVEQAARSEAFRRAVRDAYDERCAVCGVRRETPDGRPEVEAAHIRAKAEGGPDDIRNGLALCKLHHWAFDNGWFISRPEYEVAVVDASDRAGYTEFAALDGRQLQLPSDSRTHPAETYLA